MKHSHNDAVPSIVFLDGLRGLAALYVVVGHSRWLLWEGYQGYLGNKEIYSWLDTVLVYVLATFKFGHNAVLFFFVLSGFVIHLRQSRKLAAGVPLDFDAKAYITRRALRLCPPLLFCMLLTLVLDTIGQSLGYSIYFQATSDPLINFHITPHLDPLTFIGTLLFLTDSYVEIWGSNGPLWSLKYEWWFYMLYIPLLRLNAKSIYGTLGIVVILFLVPSLRTEWPEVLIPQICSMLLCWWCGVFLADVYCGRVNIPWKVLMLLIPFFPISLLDPFYYYQANDTLSALGMSGIMAACFYLQERGWRLRFLEKLKWLGDCSYTLYVIHFPILTLYAGYVLSTNDEQFPRSFHHFFAGILLSLVLAYLLHFILERPFTSAGRRPAQRKE